MKKFCRYSCFIAYGLLLAFTFISCKQSYNTKVERAFYYWKSDGYSLRDEEQKYLRDLNVQKLYVKFFEVGFDDALGAVPKAKSDFHYFNYFDDSDLVLNQINIIPTVYIKNEIFLESSKLGLDSLADNILFLTKRYYEDHIRNASGIAGSKKSSFDELQIDCDWTAKTKDKYFYLLKSLKKLSGKIISCTLRLYPYKYSNKMGVPPVDKATLMCYNLINPLESENKNSILDLDELKSYLSRGKKYPVHLDVALPIYSWMQCYQNNHFAGMIYHDNASISKQLDSIKPFWYMVTKDTLIGDLYLRAGDKIKYENINEEKLHKAIGLIKKNVPLDSMTTVSFFHLEETNLNQISYAALDSLYAHFGR